MSLQLFSVLRALEPMKLDPAAAQLAEGGTSFLAFNRAPSATARAVEFANAQTPSWPGVWPGKLTVRGTDPELRHSAAERANAMPVTRQGSMPPPPPRHLIFTEKEQAVLNSPAEAYKTYGYQESAMWMPRGGGSRAAAEKTRVIDMDQNECAPGQTTVNGFCFAGDKAKASCPPGWKYAADGQCHRVAQERAGV